MWSRKILLVEVKGGVVHKRMVLIGRENCMVMVFDPMVHIKSMHPKNVMMDWCWVSVLYFEFNTSSSSGSNRDRY